jgi:hypothetical protein
VSEWPKHHPRRRWMGTVAGCRKVTLPEAGPMQIELRVQAPAQGSVELGWDDEQRCG